MYHIHICIYTYTVIVIELSRPSGLARRSSPSTVNIRMPSVPLLRAVRTACKASIRKSDTEPIK